MRGTEAFDSRIKRKCRKCPGVDVTSAHLRSTASHLAACCWDKAERRTLTPALTPTSGQVPPACGPRTRRRAPSSILLWILRRRSIYRRQNTAVRRQTTLSFRASSVSPADSVDQLLALTCPFIFDFKRILGLNTGESIYGRQCSIHRSPFLRATVSVLAMGILSVCPSVRRSVCLSRPGTDSSPGEIETPGFHHMIA